MENVRLQRLALIAEVVSAVVVVISIVFLALETRDNTKAIHVQTHLVLTQQLNQWREQLSAEGYILARQKAQEGGIGTLTFAERARYVSMQLSLWSIYESAYFAFRNRALDQNGWDRFSKNVCNNYRGAARRGILENDDLMAGGIVGVMTEDFRHYVEDTCEYK